MHSYPVHVWKPHPANTMMQRIINANQKNNPNIQLLCVVYRINPPFLYFLHFLQSRPQCSRCSVCSESIKGASHAFSEG